jgi:hypothetical protein
MRGGDVLAEGQGLKPTFSDSKNVPLPAFSYEVESVLCSQNFFN